MQMTLHKDESLCIARTPLTFPENKEPQASCWFLTVGTVKGEELQKVLMWLSDWAIK